MKLKVFLFLMLAAVTASSYAQEGGIRGKVVSRNGRAALSDVEVTIESLGLTARTNRDGEFLFENLPAGDYTVQFSTPEFEDLEVMVRVSDEFVRDLKSVVIVPTGMFSTVDGAVFAESDDDAVSDMQALPGKLSSSKDLFSNIASYRFSEMRFNVRGLDAQYSDIMLNGIRFNDAMTGYGPWSLWSGLNDATRNQENVTGLEMMDYGIGGIGGMTNINARASQMRKGFRVSVSNGNQMYRFRAMVSYGSGQLDNGWSYAFSVGTRQGGNGYVDGVYYNSYSYFASAEKLFGQNHRLALTLLASPSERGAQQASTDEAYALFGNNYYNPNVGYQAGKLRNSRVRNTHEPIVMLNYTWDMSENTRLNAATSLRFGRNGYSALTWNAGADPRGDYYRYMPNSDKTQIVPGITTDETIYFYAMDGAIAKGVWDGMLDYDKFFQTNMRNIDTDPVLSKLMGNNSRSNYMIEERHTDQLDYNLAVNVQHNMRHNMRIVGGANLRVNRTNYYSEVKDLLGGDYWYDIDKFAERDMASAEAYQNDLDYYWATGHARIARAGDKYGYYYRAHLLETNAWANYTWGIGGFSLGVSGSVGYSNMYREGMWRKGLFPNDSKGDSKKLDYLTYDAKLSLGYKFSGAHSIEANVAYMQQAPKFATAFVSPRTRNTTTPGLKAEKIFAADLTYNLNLPYIKARLSGYYTTIEDQSKVISFYDDTRSSFTNFAMSGIDKRYYGVELGLSVPVWNGLSVVGALSWGDYTYTSNPNFVQTVDNVDKIVLKDKVNWDGYHVESSPQLAFNIGLDYRGPRNWFAGVNFNYYDNIYLSMNPMYRTATAIKYYTNVLTSNTATNAQKASALSSIKTLRKQEKFDSAYTLSANIGKNWYIHRVYMLGFSLEVKNILNDQDIRTGGYEQMRMSKVRGEGGEQIYGRFPSKYFYLFGTTYYLNVYFRF